MFEFWVSKNDCMVFYPPKNWSLIKQLWWIIELAISHRGDTDTAFSSERWLIPLLFCCLKPPTPQHVDSFWGRSSFDSWVYLTKPYQIGMNCMRFREFFHISFLQHSVPGFHLASGVIDIWGQSMNSNPKLGCWISLGACEEIQFPSMIWILKVPIRGLKLDSLNAVKTWDGSHLTEPKKQRSLQNHVF